MTDNTILVGSAYHKIPSILMVAIVLTVVIVRARWALEQTVSDAATAEDISRSLASEVVEQVTESKAQVAAGKDDTREAPALHIDIRNFTPKANVLPPEDVIALLTDYQARFTSILRHQGGVIDKFLGDGILASFGAAKGSETCARDARAALSVQATDLPPIPAIGAAPRDLDIYGAVDDSDNL